ncbi:AAA family ATPase [Nisaea sediminum]|uniref:AAA family ATPase n=1 Tax=Nisaea sediminum TaxID=2775867 RepID=UPI001866A101|nr:AAA family ATPase [Nisaea sediminum]
MKIRTQKDFERALTLAVSSLHPLIAIHSFEENRVIDSIERVAIKEKCDIIFWSCTRGIHMKRIGSLLSQADKAPDNLVKSGQNADVMTAIEAFERKLEREREKKSSERRKTFLVLLDASPFLVERHNNPAHRRRLRDFALQSRLSTKNGAILLVSSDGELTPELEKEILRLEFPLPTKDEIKGWVDDILERLKATSAVKVDEDVDFLKEAVVNAASGLTMYEIRNALSDALIEDKQLSREDVREIYRLKQDVVKKSGILEYIDTSEWSMDDVGGLDNLKEWLRKRALASTDKGLAFGITPPKGVLLTGVPGCGKSLAAKCTSTSWGIPLIKLDMGRVYASLVGASEQHIRDAISICEAVAPCVLWIDEIEKGLPRNQGHVGDSGVSLRVLATFLTWLQEKTAPVFVIATANETVLLPPEILRKGRFDEIFFIDLPNAEERKEIFRIHIGRVGHVPESFDLDALTEITGTDEATGEGGFSGAEIEAVVREALISAFSEATDAKKFPTLEQRHLEAAILETKPLSVTRAEEITGLRRWSDGRAVPATGSLVEPPLPFPFEEKLKDILKSGTP